MTGPAGLTVALYGQRPGSRFRGVLDAAVSLLVALLDGGSW
ncbi:hypothetical protein OHA04_27475 [Streptomyces sp. NBC_01590]